MWNEGKIGEQGVVGLFIDVGIRGGRAFLGGIGAGRSCPGPDGAFA